MIDESMTTSRSMSKRNTEQPGSETSGWAAFDRMQHKKQSGEGASHVEPYPSIVNKLPTSMKTATNCSTSKKSFSSVVTSSLKFPPVTNKCTPELSSSISSLKLHDNQIFAESSVSPSVKWLKNLYTWADLTLIEDILLATDNDLDQATSLLKAMSSPKNENERIKHPVQCYSIDDNMKSSGESILAEDKPEDKVSDDDVNDVPTSRKFLSPPVEPEWEESDVYSSHRKDAIRMMRAASQHSRAASNAFMRGDHAAAKSLSGKVREERAAAEKLNYKAAEEILRIRNSDNSMWKIDLHGLHASEAILALKDHLCAIESQFVAGRTSQGSRPAGFGSHVEGPSHFNSGGGLGTDSRVENKKALWRQNLLDVITGTGNHSRGQAALPAAVRSFLIENGLARHRC